MGQVIRYQNAAPTKYPLYTQVCIVTQVYMYMRQQAHKVPNFDYNVCWYNVFLKKEGEEAEMGGGGGRGEV
jgi:hypothetical protein